MAWIIQTPSNVFPNRSMYFKEIQIEENEQVALFNHWIGHAKEFETKDEARKIISDHQLTNSHIIPS